MIASGPTKVISASQASMLAGGQFIVQQAGAPGKVVGQHQILTGQDREYSRV